MSDPRKPAIDPNKLAMQLFIASESVFFLLLILAYVIFHQKANTGVQAAKFLNTTKTGIYSIFLLSSSLTVWLAGRSSVHGNRRGVITWLSATILLGAVFLFGQGTEYVDLIRHHMTISRDMFGTTFFTLTGFHGLHVFLGLVMLAILLTTGLFGRKNEPNGSALESISLYWHFVDAVWILIFSIIYLWALL